METIPCAMRYLCMALRTTSHNCNLQNSDDEAMLLVNRFAVLLVAANSMQLLNSLHVCCVQSLPPRVHQRIGHMSFWKTSIANWPLLRRSRRERKAFHNNHSVTTMLPTPLGSKGVVEKTWGIHEPGK